MNALGWFGMGFLLASLAMWAVMRMISIEIRSDNAWLRKRVAAAEDREQQATDRARLAEEWSQMLGASLYGEAKDIDSD